MDLANRWRVTLVSLVSLGILVFALGNLHNWWSTFLPAVVGPVLMSLVFAWRPLLFFPRAPRRGEENGNLNEAARQLTRRLDSREAKRVLLVTGIATSAGLCITMWGISLLRTQAFDWTFNMSYVAPLTFLFALWSMTIHYHVLLRWARPDGVGSSGT